jgi:1,2-diacylglycerol 3-alpha-glucosyltransferase
MRVCILLESYPPRVGGTPTHARLLAEDLARMGVAVRVLTRRWDATVPREESAGGIRIARIGPTGRGPLKKWRMLPSALAALGRFRREYDVIYVPGLRVLGIAGVLAARLFGKRCVLRSVSCGEVSGRFFDAGLDRARVPGLRAGFRLGLAARNRVLRRADAFVAVSSAIEDEMRAAGLPAARIRRIPNGVDTRRFRPAGGPERAVLRERLGLPRDATVAAYTGRLVRYKGLPMLLGVWADVLAQAPAARLLLVGGGGSDIANCEAELRAFVAGRGLADRVLFTGDVVDVEAYLRAADLFVFPTENEAFGISLIEAMACGLPVVASLVGGCRDIVAHEQDGLLVPPGDAAGFRSAILRIVADPALGRRLGERAVATVAARYGRETIAAAYAALFEELSA